MTFESTPHLVSRAPFVEMKSTNSGAWVAYGQSDDVILSMKGGRQGCKSGPIVFNATYSLALKYLREKLVAGGVSAQFKMRSKSFWSDLDDGCETEETFVDVTFVDDECIVVTASTPYQVDQKIDKMLCALTCAFNLFKLQILARLRLC